MRRAFPGPRPYEEADWAVFKGREAEVVDLLRRVEQDRLVLLSGESSVGKTSLLRAGLIPLLRARRGNAVRQAIAAQKRRARNTGTATQSSEQQQLPALAVQAPGVLLLRDWNTAPGRSPEQVVADAIARNLVDLESLERIYEDDRDIPAGLVNDRLRVFTDERRDQLRNGQAVVSWLLARAEEANGLVIALDQFEEVLRSPVGLRNAILDMVADLYTDPRRQVRLILSYRQEFQANLRGLDRRLHSLRAFGAHIEALPPATLKTALIEAAEAADVKFAPAAVDSVLRWFVHGNVTDATDLLPDFAQLRLGAILVDLVDEASSTSRNKAIRITTTTVEKLRSRAERALQEEFGTANDRPTPTPEAQLVETALVGYLDRHVVPIPAAFVGHHGIPAPVAKALREQAEWPLTYDRSVGTDVSAARVQELRRAIRELQIRRVTARLAAHLSAGTLKVPLSLGVLVARSWRTDWLRLGFTEPQVEHAFHGYTELDDPTIESVLSSLAVGKVAGPASPSGPARRWGWNVQQILRDSFLLTRETLKLLLDTEILRRSAGRYELVHDGFGPALVQWANNWIGHPQEVLASFVAQRGDSFRWQRLEGVVDHAAWPGCWLGPAGANRCQIDSVRFEQCDLRGLVFVDCDFVDTTFVDCRVIGAYFDNCTFNGSGFEGGSLAGTVFADCSFVESRFSGVAVADVGFQRASFQDVVFHQVWAPAMLWNEVSVRRVSIVESVLAHCSFQSVGVVGKLEANDCWIGLCDLQGLAEDAIEHLDFAYSQFVHCLVQPGVEHHIRSGEAGQKIHPAICPDFERYMHQVPMGVPAWLESGEHRHFREAAALR